MKDLYKAIDNLNNIIIEEDSVNEKIDLKTGKYKGTNITPTKKQLDRLKRSGEVPKNYKLPEPPLAKTNPTIKRFLDRFKDKDTPKPNVSQGSTIAKKELPKLKQKQPDPLDKIQGRKKVKATAANTKDYDKTLALQKQLIAKGAKIKADGIMGPNTRAAMKKFGQVPPVPKMRPKSGGPDKRFITGPELDMPNKRDPFLAAPPERMNRIPKNNQINSPGALGGKVKPITTPDGGLNRYAVDRRGNYRLIQKPKGSDKGPLDGIRTSIANLFKPKQTGSGQMARNTTKKQAISTSVEPKKSMIEAITGKKTCL